MNTQSITIQINEQEYDLRFGYASLRALCRIQGTNDLNKVFTSLGSLGAADSGTLSLEMIDTLAQIIMAAILAKNPAAHNDLDVDAVADWILYDLDMAMQVLQSFMDSMPKQDDAAKKKNPAPRSAKKKKS